MQTLRSLFRRSTRVTKDNKLVLDKKVKDNVEKALTVMHENEALRSLSLHLRVAVDVFCEFNCNHEAALVLRDLVVTVILRFGITTTPSSGASPATSVVSLIEHAAKAGKQFPQDKIQALEEWISSHTLYCTRFTGNDVIAENDGSSSSSSSSSSSLVFLLVGDAPATTMTRFDQGLRSLMNELMLSLDAPGGPLPTAPQYRIACNLLPDIREFSKQHISWDEYVSRQATVRGVTKVDDVFSRQLKQEFERIHQFSNDYIEESMSFIQHQDYGVLKQVAFRHFWSSKVHPLYSITPELFISLLQQHLSSFRASSTVITDIVNGFRKGLASEIKATKTVDVYSLARLLRFAPVKETDFVAVATTVANKLNHGLYALLPSFDHINASIVYDPNQKEELTKAVLANQGHIVSITGPKLSGKTYRLLHLLHSELAHSTATATATTSKPRDVVWIDFAKIDRDADAIARIASQLFLRRVNTVEDLETAMTTFLDTVVAGSVVVIDNLSFVTLNSEMISKVSPLKRSGSGNNNNSSNISNNNADMTMIQDDKDNSDYTAGFASFVQRFLKFVVAKSSDKLNIVIVGHDLTTVREVVKFTHEIEVGPLTKPVAVEFIQAYSATLSHKGRIPNDIEALVVASSCLPGEITLFANSGSLGGIRKVSRAIEAAKANNNNNNNNDLYLFHHAKSIAAIEIFNQLTADEQLLTSCLFSSYPYFDESMVWSMSKKVFHNDILRWDIAWKGLLNAGWVIHNPDLGFAVSTIASYVKTTCDALTTHLLYEWYISHWTDELVRINFAAYTHPSFESAVLEYFTHNMSHFKRVYASVLKAKVRAAVSMAGNANAVPLSSSPDGLSGTPKKQVRSNLFSSGNEFKLTPLKTDPVKRLSLTSIFSPRQQQHKTMGGGGGGGGGGGSKSTTNTLSSIFSPRKEPEKQTKTRERPKLSLITSSKSEIVKPPEFVSNSTQNSRNLVVEIVAPTEDADAALPGVPTTQLDANESVFFSFPDRYTCDVSELTDEDVFSSTVSKLSAVTLEAIVYKLSGKNTPLLNYHFSTATSVTIASAFKSQLTYDDGDVYDYACIELAEQHFRAGFVQLAMDEIYQTVQYLGYTKGQPVNFDDDILPPFASRAFILYARILMANYDFEGVVTVCTAALSEGALAGLPKVLAEPFRLTLTQLKDEASKKVGTKNPDPEAVPIIPAPPSNNNNSNGINTSGSRTPRASTPRKGISQAAATAAATTATTTNGGGE